MSTLQPTRKFSEVSVGDELPPLSIDITTRLIVSAAIASGDFQDVHHDKPGAQALGSPDIFMNILTTNGLVGRYVTDWAGPNALLRAVKIKLGAPNYPGDTMVLKGRVTALGGGDEQLVEIEVGGKNGLGYHVTGSVTVALP
ncbi:MAG: MaoC family dehydratase [Gammaproteobacteria bacterium]|nr:MaoC family dehydratase [Gammaproteobacteria bacterium]